MLLKVILSYNAFVLKESEEIDLIQKSLILPKKDLDEFSLVKPNVMEYEIEASSFMNSFTSISKGFAYTPIIGSGNNANVCIISKTTNNVKMAT
jgi:Xaa-Pro aminopeptidase